MILNYIKTALRNFQSNKSITLIKILGLSLGLAVTFYILIFVNTETSYNDYNINKERIYRVNVDKVMFGFKTIHTPYPMRDALLDAYPEIKSATRIIQLYKSKINKENEWINETNFLCVDKDFFEIITLKTINGNFSTFSNSTDQVVLTKSMATKYFGSTDIVNKPIRMKLGDNEYDLNVVAVIEDLPYTSTIKADFIANIELGLQEVNSIMIRSDGLKPGADFYRTNWGVDFVETYLLFKDQKDASGFDLKLKEFESVHIDDTTKSDFYIQNIEDIYLGSNDIITGSQLGDKNSIYIFSAVAFLVLLIACINYIILSIAQVLTRTKEIGIRKIVGAKQSNLFKQITVESLIIVLLTVPLAFIIIEQFRPVLEKVVNKHIVIIYNPEFIIAFILIISFVVFIPGLNIIYYLNRISPISILRKQNLGTSQKFNLRKVLMVVQFIIFISLVILSIGIKKQIDYSMQNDLGFDPENKIVVNIDNQVQEGNYETIKTELLRNPLINNVSGAMWLPPTSSKMTYSYTDSAFTEPVKLEALFVDRDFMETFNIKLLKGKSLSEFQNGQKNIVINKEAEKIFGEGNAIGKDIWGSKIIGVVDNIRFHSVHEPIGPMIFISDEDRVREMVISFENNITDNDLFKLKNDLDEFDPDLSSKTELLKSKFDFLYKKEIQLVKLLTLFSLIAIFIASIGLLGTTIFTTKKQTKNIAIRKVNGATSGTILKLLLGDYIKLVFFSFIISSPIAYYLLNKWLQNFEFQVHISWMWFILAGILAFVITVLTISWYSLNAAKKNPVESLRYE